MSSSSEEGKNKRKTGRDAAAQNSTGGTTERRKETAYVLSFSNKWSSASDGGQCFINTFKRYINLLVLFSWPA